MDNFIPSSDYPVWIVVVGFIIAFFLAFGVGANDVANSFGTSVGSKVLTLRQACILATIFEILGCVLLGYQVSETIRKDLFDVNIYEPDPKLLMIGMLAALTGSAIWNIVATVFGLPVSGTHGIVGAVVGFSLVANGTKGIYWGTVGKVVASWFISPLLSGIVSALIFLVVRRFILKKKDPLTPGLRSLPFFYGITVLVNVFSVVYQGPKEMHFDRLCWWVTLLIALGFGFLTGILVWVFVVPRMRRKIKDANQPEAHNAKLLHQSEERALSSSYTDDMANGKTQMTPITSEVSGEKTANGITELRNGGSIVASKNPSAISYIKMEKDSASDSVAKVEVAKSDVATEGNGYNLNSKLVVEKQDLEAGKSLEPTKPEDDPTSDSPEAAELFSFLQILTAIFGSFAHGANDVSNAIGPLITLWLMYQEETVDAKGSTPFYLPLYGGIGISAGLWIWGRKVIKTLGEDLTKITPSSGFTIEIGAASTVLFASKIGLPISTTHCKVGSVVFVGWLRSRQGVDWSLFRNIILAWGLTVPATGLLTAALMAVLQVLVT